MEKCKTCYLVNAKPCYECSACINGDDHYKYWPNAQTNAQHIRGMSDEELAVWILRNVDCDKENIMCTPALYKNSDKCDGRCRDGRLSWLRRPAETEGTE